MARGRKIERMEFKAPKHPSGRPIVFGGRTELTFKRHVHEEPLTPGLRRHEGVPAIGFTARIAADDE